MIVVQKSTELHVAFWITIGGMMISNWSRNVRLKRIVLPLTLSLFCAVWLESCRLTANPPMPVLLVIAGFMAVRVARAVRTARYCTQCGRTMQPKRRRKRCPECVRGAAPVSA